MRRCWLVLALAGCTFDPLPALDPDAPAGPDTPPIGDDASLDAPLPPDAPGFDPTTCPSSYEPLGTSTSRYRLRSSASFRDGHRDCEDDRSGLTHLIVLDALGEGTAAATLAGGDYWVGAVQRPGQANVADSWFWLTGGDVPATAWEPGQPDDGNPPEGDDQNVARYAVTGLDDSNGGDSKPVICECDGRPIDATIEGYIPSGDS